MVAAMLFAATINAQQWDGASNSTDPIFRTGKVSIGTDNNNDKLNLNGNLRLTGNSGNKIIFGGGTTSAPDEWAIDGGLFHFEMSGYKLYLHPYTDVFFGEDPNTMLKKAFSM